MQVGAVHGIHGLGAFLVVIASQGRRRCTCLNPAVADLLGRLLVGVLLLGWKSRWRSSQGSLLELGAKVVLELAVQAEDTFGTAVYLGQRTVPPSDLGVLNSIAIGTLENVERRCGLCRSMLRIRRDAVRITLEALVQRARRTQDRLRANFRLVSVHGDVLVYLNYILSIKTPQISHFLSLCYFPVGDHKALPAIIAGLLLHTSHYSQNPAKQQKPRHTRVTSRALSISGPIFPQISESSPNRIRDKSETFHRSLISSPLLRLNRSTR